MLGCYIFGIIPTLPFHMSIMLCQILSRHNLTYCCFDYSSFLMHFKAFGPFLVSRWARIWDMSCFLAKVHYVFLYGLQYTVVRYYEKSHTMPSSYCYSHVLLPCHIMMPPLVDDDIMMMMMMMMPMMYIKSHKKRHNKIR